MEFAGKNLGNKTLLPGLKIDKVKLGIIFNELPTGKQTYEQLSYYVRTANDHTFCPDSKHWTHKSSAWSFAKFVLDGCPLAVGFGYCPDKVQRAFFEFTAGSFTPEAFVGLRALIELCVYGGWNEFIEHAQIGIVELAFDVFDSRFDEFTFVHTSANKAFDQFQALGSSYSGGLRSRVRLAFYDKGKQLRDKGIMELPMDVLRIEARLAPIPKIALLKLPSVPNPFNTVIVVDKKLLQEGKSMRLGRFKKEVLTQGVSGQTSFMECAATGPFNRLELASALKPFQPSWWSPAEIWSHVGEAMQAANLVITDY